MPQNFADLRNPPVIPHCHYGPTETSTDADPCDRFDAFLNAGRRAAVAFATRQDGGPATEFALVAPIFIVVVYATVQCAIIYICNAYLETGAEEAARQVLTNQSTLADHGAIQDGGVQQHAGAV